MRVHFVSNAPLHLNSPRSSRECWWSIERGIDRQPEHGYISYRSGFTDQVTTAQDRTIDFSDTTSVPRMDCGHPPLLHSSGIAVTLYRTSEHILFGNQLSDGPAGVGRSILSHRDRDKRPAHQRYGLIPSMFNRIR